MWGQLLTAVPRNALEIWKQEPDLRTLSYPIMIDYKQIQHKIDILSHVGIVGFFFLQLLFFWWRTKGSACSFLSQLLKESMDTSTTSDQYILVLCQPRKKERIIWLYCTCCLEREKNAGSKIVHKHKGSVENHVLLAYLLPCMNPWLDILFDIRKDNRRKCQQNWWNPRLGNSNVFKEIN